MLETFFREAGKVLLGSPAGLKTLPGREPGKRYAGYFQLRWGAILLKFRATEWPSQKPGCGLSLNGCETFHNLD